MLRKKQLIIDYQQKFGDEQGSRVLKDLEKHCTLFRKGLSPGTGIDVNAVLVMEGQSNVIKHIYNMMQKDPNQPAPSTAINITSGTGE